MRLRFAEFQIMHRWLRAVAAGAIALGGLARPASAANVYASYMSLPYYEIVDLTGGMLGTRNGVYAGQQVLTVNDGSVYNPLGTSMLDAWCVDFFHDIYIGGNSIDYSLSSLTDDHSGATPATSHPLSAGTARELAGLVVYGNQAMQAAPSNLLSAAVQVAIWNIEYGSAYAGSDAALAAEVCYLMGIAPSLDSTSGEVLNSFDPSRTYYQFQSLLYSQAALSGGQDAGPVVPEPGSIALLAGGVGLLVLMLAWRGANRRIGRPRQLPPGGHGFLR